MKNDNDLSPEDLSVIKLVEHFIGTPFSRDMVDTMIQLTDRRVRLLAGVVTRDYVPSRLNIRINDQREISGFSFG
jgi:hypothetical protein